MHMSLDGYVAGPNGEMDWIRVDADIWPYVTRLTDAADTALFGRNTYKMMEAYWPTAADQPGASQHDIDHSRWINNARKIVFSNTLKETNWDRSMIASGPIAQEVQKLRKEAGKNLLMIGSTSLSHAFTELGLIDDYYINLNPVLLGMGMPLFTRITETTNLKLVESHTFKCGVVGLHYESQ